ncbi:Ssb Single-stranded DNA-binding protein [uncultured Caudovirales phage]|uniref:Single-stranded DNA-binding protein n=1 Tax=uncultured Caudovirales phage TaxID=2100421 RepID=A0A6J7W863_9CAUD|nr:Ssb Single-stranded DNA-binding protein [uncultured Caudovirales phage]
MNKITFDGRLTKDAEVKFLPSGDAVLVFSVASDIGFGDKKQTNFFSCRKFGKGAEGLGNFLKKGQQVTIYGSLTLRQYGEGKTSPDVKVDEVSLQGGKSEGSQSGGRAEYNDVPKPPKREYGPAKKDADIDEDIPF